MNQTRRVRERINYIHGITYEESLLSVLDPFALWMGNETSGTTMVDSAGTRNGTYTSVTLNATQFLDGSPAGLWDGTNDYANIYNALTAATAFNPAADFSVGIWIKKPSWDAVLRRFFVALADISNFIIFNQTNATTIQAAYGAGGTNKQVSKVISPVNEWFSLVMTVSPANDRMKVYYNGAQEGLTQTGLGSWVGSFDSTSCVIGARSTVPVNPHLGNLGPRIVAQREWTPTEVKANFDPTRI